MLREVTIVLPTSLLSPGKGTLSLPIRLDGVDLEDYRVSCKIEGIVERREFDRSGALALLLPGDLIGGLNPTIEVAHRRGGGRFSGAFRVEISHYSAPGISVATNGHEVEGTGVVYQPIEVYGREAKAVEVVGRDARVTVPLKPEMPDNEVPLRNLIEREECLLLPDRGDGILRVLQIAVGPQLVIGRCYASQLNPAGRLRLERVKAGIVDWVSSWDDTGLNRVSAALRHGSRKVDAPLDLAGLLEGALRRGSSAGRIETVLEIENLTDYSRHRSPLFVEGGGRRASVEPAQVESLEVHDGTVVSITTGEGSASRLVSRFRFEDLDAGNVAVPVYRTDGMTFRSPPDGGTGALTVHFLGVWIPLEDKKLRKILKVAAEPLHIAFPADEVFLWIGWNARRKAMMVTGNEDLVSCLGGGWVDDGAP